MVESAEFFCAPGSDIEPGDVFCDIPFPSLKYPLEFFRVNTTKDKSTASLFTHEEVKAKGGDSPRAKLGLRMVMLISHGCEVDRVLRYEDADRRHWLCAPINELASANPQMQKRAREGRQPNRFYLPPYEALGGEELLVDLRKITPINCQYFLDGKERGKRICGLTRDAQLELYSQLGVFFSGLALYVQSIPCPKCGTPIDPTQFQIPSDVDPDVD